MVFPQLVGLTIKKLEGDLKENPGPTHLNMIAKSELQKNDLFSLVKRVYKRFHFQDSPLSSFNLLHLLSVS